MQLVRDGYQIQVDTIADFLINFRAHMRILCTIKAKILVLIK